MLPICRINVLENATLQKREAHRCHLAGSHSSFSSISVQDITSLFRVAGQSFKTFQDASHAEYAVNVARHCIREAQLAIILSHKRICIIHLRWTFKDAQLNLQQIIILEEDPKQQRIWHLPSRLRIGYCEGRRQMQIVPTRKSICSFDNTLDNHGQRLLHCSMSMAESYLTMSWDFQSRSCFLGMSS